MSKLIYLLRLGTSSVGDELTDLQLHLYASVRYMHKLHGIRTDIRKVGSVKLGQQQFLQLDPLPFKLL